MNLGCGTLLVLLILVFVGGQLIPHGHERSELPRSETVKEPRAVALPSKPNAAKALSEAPANPPPVPRSPSAGKDPALDLTLKMGEIEQQLRSLDLKQIETRWGSFLAEAETQIRRLSEAPEAPPRSTGAASHPQAKSEASPPPSPAEAEGLDPRDASRGTRPGQDAVFNNPFTESVDQVEKYLRQHVHDGASLEILGWSAVEKGGRGYSVSCTYRSKNVLGKPVTQTQRFILDRQGVILDVTQ